MIITRLPSIYCVPGIVLSALPMLLYLILIRVKYKRHRAKEKKNPPLFLFGVGGGGRVAQISVEFTAKSPESS